MSVTITNKDINDKLSKPEYISDIDIKSEYEKNYVKKILKAVDDGITKYKDANFFFLEVLTIRPRALIAVNNAEYIARSSLPMPYYNQTLYIYQKEGEKLDFLWKIPDKRTALHLYFNQDKYSSNNIRYLPYVIEFFNGDLIKKRDILRDKLVEKESNGRRGNVTI